MGRRRTFQYFVYLRRIIQHPCFVTFRIDILHPFLRRSLRRRVQNEIALMILLQGQTLVHIQFFDCLTAVPIDSSV